MGNYSCVNYVSESDPGQGWHRRGWTGESNLKRQLILIKPYQSKVCPDIFWTDTYLKCMRTVWS